MTLDSSAGRDRYLDTLRALAILRVIVYHGFGFVWLTYALPAMGVMFALGGSLMAGSLGRPGNRAIRSRVRRLLPALWLLAALVLPVMIWQATRDGVDIPRTGLLLWLFPVAEPPGTEWLLPVTIVLWYVTTYLWLVLLSPLALRAYRRWPLLTVLAPLVVLGVTQVALPGLGLDLDNSAGEVVVNVATFGACWVLGFAHRDGTLRRLAWPLILGLAAVAMVAGAAWAFTHPSEEGLDLNEIPLAQGLYSLGFVLILMKVRPTMAWVSRVPPADWLVTAVNSRAVTIYLWHNIAITLCFAVGEVLDVWRYGDRLGDAACAVIAMVLLAVSVLALGWAEDLAARRPPRLLPRRHSESRSRPASHPPIVDVPHSRTQGGGQRITA